MRQVRRARRVRARSARSACAPAPGARCRRSAGPGARRDRSASVCPAPAVGRLLQPEPGIDGASRVAEEVRPVVGVVHLHRAHLPLTAQVERQPSPRRGCCRATQNVRGSSSVTRAAAKAVAASTTRRRLAIGQQHPAGEQTVRGPSTCRSGSQCGKVAEAGVGVHLPVGVEAGGEHRDPPLEVPVDPDPRRAGVPPVAVRVLEGVAVAGAGHEAARLVRDRVVRRVLERARAARRPRRCRWHRRCTRCPARRTGGSSGRRAWSSTRPR